MIRMSSRAAKTARDFTLDNRAASKDSNATIEGAGSLALLGVTVRLNAGQFVVRLNA
jgi:hypothetical protein